MEEPRQTGGDDSVSESVEISFEEHVAPMSTPLAPEADESKGSDPVETSSLSEPVDSREEDLQGSQDISESNQISESKEEEVEFKESVQVEQPVEPAVEVEAEAREEKDEEEKKEVPPPKPSSPTVKPSSIPKRSPSPVKSTPKSPRTPEPSKGQEVIKKSSTKKVRNLFLTKLRISEYCFWRISLLFIWQCD